MENGGEGQAGDGRGQWKRGMEKEERDGGRGEGWRRRGMGRGMGMEEGDGGWRRGMEEGGGVGDGPQPHPAQMAETWLWVILSTDPKAKKTTLRPWTIRLTENPILPLGQAQEDHGYHFGTMFKTERRGRGRGMEEEEADEEGEGRAGGGGKGGALCTLPIPTACLGILLIVNKHILVHSNSEKIHSKVISKIW